MSTLTMVLAADRDGGHPVRVHAGTRLLDGIGNGPGLEAHHKSLGGLRRWTVTDLLDVLDEVGIRGRGGAGFPFATKLRAAADASGRPTVVVNLSEGEPASFKDAALALTRPHLVLDGASVTARALRARTVHVVLPGEHPAVERSVRRAISERAGRDGRVHWRLHTADPRFVAGQARAVIELMSGRENLPVTAWEPEAVKGYRGRPTLLSNAETFAQVALLVAGGSSRYRSQGTDDEPGTLLLTVGGDGPRPEVVEVAHGTPWNRVLAPQVLDGPVLLGGYHGTWAGPGRLAGMTVSRPGMTGAGLALGAGVVLPLEPGSCPLHRTARITGYLAGQSANRCGPCLNGLPALAEAVWELYQGLPTTERVHQLTGLVSRRGACAHPDGTVRLVQSMITAFPDELEAHSRGHCLFAHPSSVVAHSPGVAAGRHS